MSKCEREGRKGRNTNNRVSGPQTLMQGNLDASPSLTLMECTIYLVIFSLFDNYICHFVLYRYCFVISSCSAVFVCIVHLLRSVRGTSLLPL